MNRSETSRRRDEEFERMRAVHLVEAAEEASSPYVGRHVVMQTQLLPFYLRYKARRLQARLDRAWATFRRTDGRMLPNFPLYLPPWAQGVVVERVGRVKWSLVATEFKVFE